MTNRTYYRCEHGHFASQKAAGSSCAGCVAKGISGTVSAYSKGTNGQWQTVQAAPLLGATAITTKADELREKLASTKLGITSTSSAIADTRDPAEVVFRGGKHLNKKMGELLADGRGRSYLKWLVSQTDWWYQDWVDGVLVKGYYAEHAQVLLDRFNATVKPKRTRKPGIKLPEKAEPSPVVVPPPGVPEFLKPSERGGAALDKLRDSFDGEIVTGDPIMNESIKHMLQGYVSSLVGKYRKIEFKEGGGFATDMQGTLYLDPYPLGRTAPVAHNLAVLMAGMNHELGHELYTNPDHWRKVLDTAKSPDPVDGLDDGRKIIPHIYNIIEDGRMEREVSLEALGAAQQLAIGCKLQPRWDEKVGEGVPVEHQVYGAMLYTALPYFKVRDEVRAAMSPKARAIFEEVEPFVKKGVLGSKAESLEASFEITRILEKYGFGTPPPELDVRPPADPDSLEKNGGGAGRDDKKDQPDQKDKADKDDKAESGNSAGGDGTGEPDKSDTEPSGGAGNADSSDKEEEDKKKSGGQPGNQNAKKDETESGDHAEAGSKSGDKADSKAESGDKSGDKANSSKPAENKPLSGDSAGGYDRLSDKATDWHFSDKDLAKTFDRMEAEAGAVINGEIRKQAKVENFGKKLHGSVKGKTAEEQVYLDGKGRVSRNKVHMPLHPDKVDFIKARRDKHKEGARQIATYLKTIRDEAERRTNLQTKGKLDRSRFVAAVKGARDVYSRDEKNDTQTAMAVSLLIDQTGSMRSFAEEGTLVDATLTLSDALGMLDMPHEVRACGKGQNDTMLYKSMSDKELDLDRAGGMLIAGGDGERFDFLGGLAATSLRARPEKNKLVVCLTDSDITGYEGGKSISDRSAEQLRTARENGCVTFGVCFGQKGMKYSSSGESLEEANDKLYGKGNWVQVESVADLPQAVGAKIAQIFKMLR
jgi:hypothetical protein